MKVYKLASKLTPRVVGRSTGNSRVDGRLRSVTRKVNLTETTWGD